MKSTSTSAPAEHVGERRAERRVGAAGELEVVGALDGGAHGLAHAAGGARDGDARRADHAAARRQRPSAARNASSSGPMPAADSRSGAHSSCGERREVVERHGVDALHQLVRLEQRQPVQQRAAEPVHARAGGLQREDDPRLDVLLARARAPPRSPARARRRLELGRDDLHRLAEVVRPGADVEADLARVLVLPGERVDAVGQAALLAHGLEQPRRATGRRRSRPAPGRRSAARRRAAARRRRGRRAPARCPCAGSARSAAGRPARASGAGARVVAREVAERALARARPPRRGRPSRPPR